LIERIGEKTGKLIQKNNGKKTIVEEEIKTHSEAFKLMVRAMLDKKNGIISSVDDIFGIGHRTVHAGEDYAVVITDHVIECIENNNNLAPLHNPANLIGIREAQAMFPHVKNVGVFDTAFHQTMPKQAYLYALPAELYTKYGVRRYGFHGTSHKYVSNIAYTKYGIDRENSGVISCHLGNGASICAIENGKSIDTSMGLTPLEGLMMGTRSGDIDPGIIFFLHENGYSFEDINVMLNKKSGMLGLSGISNDMRDVESEAEKGNKQAQSALEAYAYRIAKYIGGYKKLHSIGIKFDSQRNQDCNHKEGIISAEESATKIIIIPTNEELQIALETYELVK